MTEDITSYLTGLVKECTFLGENASNNFFKEENILPLLTQRCCHLFSHQMSGGLCMSQLT